MKKSGFEHCTDDVSSSFPAATETGLSVMVDRDVSHDPISPFLSAQDWTFKDLWNPVNPQPSSRKLTCACF